LCSCMQSGEIPSTRRASLATLCLSCLCPLSLQFGNPVFQLHHLPFPACEDTGQSFEFRGPLGDALFELFVDGPNLSLGMFSLKPETMVRVMSNERLRTKSR